MKIVEILKENESRVEEALTSLWRLMKGQRRFRSHDNEPQWIDQRTMMAEIRDWGEWVVPEGEIDDGDYDWNVLSEGSERKLKEILDHYSQKYPDISFSAQQEEKNWLSLFARSGDKQ
jgi:hypothetical protein